MNHFIRVVSAVGFVAVALAFTGCAADRANLATERCLDKLSYCPQMLELDYTP